MGLNLPWRSTSKAAHCQRTPASAAWLRSRASRTSRAGAREMVQRACSARNPWYQYACTCIAQPDAHARAARLLLEKTVVRRLTLGQVLGRLRLGLVVARREPARERRVWQLAQPRHLGEQPTDVLAEPMHEQRIVPDTHRQYMCVHRWAGCAHACADGACACTRAQRDVRDGRGQEGQVRRHLEQVRYALRAMGRAGGARR